MDNELKPSTQLSSRQKRNKFIMRLAMFFLVLPGLMNILCSVFNVTQPPAIQSIAPAISGVGILLFLFWFSRPRQEWGIPSLSQSKAKKRWRLLVSIMVLTYVIFTVFTVFVMIKKQVPISMILMQNGLVALITIPIFAITLCIFRKMLGKFSQPDTPEQIADETRKE